MTRRQEIATLTVIVVSFVTVFLTLQLKRVACLGAYAFDLGIFQQTVWLMAHGKRLFVTVRGLHCFADHFRPVLFVFAPFYRLWPHPFWLLFGQTVALACGTIPLYRMVKRNIGYSWTAILLPTIFLLHPALFSMLFFDFHPILLSVPFVLWAMDAMDKNSPFSFFVASLLAMSCKQEVSISIIGLSLYGLLLRRRWWGGAGMILGLLWLYVALQIMAKLGGVERSAYFSFYAQWGNTPLQIIWNVFSNPLRTVKQMIICKSPDCPTQPYVYPLLLLAPLGFLPLLAPEFLVFSIPCYALIALSGRPTMQEIGFQYPSLLLPWLAGASISGLRRLKRVSLTFHSPLRRRWNVMLFLCLAFCSVPSAYRYGVRLYRRFNAHSMPPHVARKIVNLLHKIIPPHASVSAPSTLVPPLAHRQSIFLFTNPFQKVVWGASERALEQQVRPVKKILDISKFHRRMQVNPVDFIVLKKETDFFPFTREAFEQAAIYTLTSPNYGIVAVLGDMVILKRGEDFKKGLEKIGLKISNKCEKEEIAKKVRQAWEKLVWKNGLNH